MKRLKFAFSQFAVLTLLGVVTPLVAQIQQASITGLVTDPGGASIPSAIVVVTNRDTGAVHRTQTNAAGMFLATSLVPGAYSVQVEMNGFKVKRIEKITIDTGQAVRIDIALDLGSMDEAIEVKAATTELRRESAEVSATVDSTEVRNLPVSGRSPFDLMFLSSGVAPEGDPSSPNFGVSSINGGRTGGNVFLVDGAPATSVDGQSERQGSIEAVQQFKVLGSSYSAEYSRSSGAVILTQVKSGTLQYHGSLYEYHRDNALAANQWQNNATGVKQAALIRNEFGGTFGGPVPHLRRKMFFFVSYEGYRDRIPINRTRTIPSESIRRGDFSALPVIINDPLTGKPFPGNIIPANRLDPAALKFLALMPQPNTTGTFNKTYGIYTNNWVRSTTTSYPKNWGVMRIDYNPTDRDTISVTYAHLNEGPRLQGYDFDSALNTISWPTIRNMRRATIGWTRTIHSNLINQLQAYGQRDPKNQTQAFPDFDAQRELGIQNTFGNALPTISISGGFGNYGVSPWSSNVNQPAGLSEIATWVRGRHTIRFGAQLFQSQYSYDARTNTAGSYSFTGDITGLGNSGNPINALADLQLGAIKSASIDLPQLPITRVLYNFGVFAQDDWKVTTRLNLSMGLRYEFEKPQVVKNNMFSQIDVSSGQLLVAGRNASRTLNLTTDDLNFSPRLGIVYSVNDQTVVRSGFGLFYASRLSDTGTSVVYPGLTGSLTFADSARGKALPFTLSQGFPLTSVPPVTDPLAVFAAATVSRPFTVNANAFVPGDALPYTLQWNVSVQRAIGFGADLDIAYVGSRGVHLARKVPMNRPTLDRAAEVVIAKVPLQQVRPFPNVGGYNAIFYDALSSYESLQLKLKRRMRNGLSLNMTYTFSKNIDTATNYSSDSFQIPWQYPEIERAVSGLDRTHIFGLSGVYELPFGPKKPLFSNNRLISAIVGGFQLNAIFSASTGQPRTITQNNTNLILASQRPDVIDPNNLSGRSPNPTTVNAAYRLLLAPGDPNFPFTPSSNIGIGNLGRNTTRSPGAWNLNLGVFRVFRLSERFRLEMRGEAYNALNHVNWGTPNTNISDANFGLITTAWAARQMQIGARLSF